MRHLVADASRVSVYDNTFTVDETSTISNSLGYAILKKTPEQRNLYQKYRMFQPMKVQYDVGRKSTGLGRKTKCSNINQSDGRDLHI